ncbi:MAG: zinc ribbon domain-containing protein [Planctomycetota bacterium]|nr:zinc ribbon domain-containing protein [Planctomycetota bacterium]
MATYEYRCKKCKRTFEKTMTFSEHDRSKPACPKCKSRSVEQRPSLFQAAGNSKG